eukprot:TRINITY_DN8450_c0_g1_i4.p1 TRINITY_DN8450_c0_g1~~TRINITY_DN8450_c0_g1_i4.p1  ORF type:complete len:293 (-),score=87.31 TRINITY_DN8450_c0_g1_i4:132-1010(-)
MIAQLREQNVDVEQQVQTFYVEEIKRLELQLEDTRSEAAMQLALVEQETIESVEQLHLSLAETKKELEQTKASLQIKSAGLAQAEGQVEELEAQVAQSETALQLERKRVEELDDKFQHSSVDMQGYKVAFLAMHENEAVVEADIQRLKKQIKALKQEIELRDIQARWGEQRRQSMFDELSTPTSPIFKDLAALGECHEHFETEVWEKKMFGRSRWQPADQGFKDQDPPAGFAWNGEWQIDGTYTSVDDDGWSYGTSEQEVVERAMSDLSNSKKAKDDEVRLRKWVRSIVADQ